MSSCFFTHSKLDRERVDLNVIFYTEIERELDEVNTYFYTEQASEGVISTCFFVHRER